GSWPGDRGSARRSPAPFLIPAGGLQAESLGAKSGPAGAWLLQTEQKRSQSAQVFVAQLLVGRHRCALGDGGGIFQVPDLPVQVRFASAFTIQWRTDGSSLATDRMASRAAVLLVDHFACLHESRIERLRRRYRSRGYT